MTRPVEEVASITGIRRECMGGNGIFRLKDGETAVFHPETARRVNALNYADLTLPDKLADAIRGRTSEPFSWKTIRAAWLAQLRELSGAAGIAALSKRMEALLAERADKPLDLVWAAQEVFSQALIPTVVGGLSPRDQSKILRDQHYKLKRLLVTKSAPSTLWKEARSIAVQISAGNVVRRELRGRKRGKRPRQQDLTDPVVDMLPELGIDRAVDAVTAVLTAIAGPPGSAAACVLYELSQRPDWLNKLTNELRDLAPEDLHGNPAKAAPITHRFVKEILRLWSPPILMTRPVRTDIDTEHLSMKAGERFVLSTFFVHHHPDNWQDPETFDPDRWLVREGERPCAHASYVPFGWSPKSCIGAQYGTIQLMMFCRLICAHYRIELTRPEAVKMVLAAVPLPVNFEGRLVPV